MGRSDFGGPPWWFKLAAVGFVVLFVSTGVWVAIGTSLAAGTVRGHAESYAREHAASILGMRRPVATCMGVDSDHNGYVTCTVADAEDRAVRPQQLECAANVVIEANTGCREYRLRTLDVRGAGGE